MKKLTAFVVSLLACITAFVGCASRDDVDSNPAKDSSFTREDSYYSGESSYYRYDSSKTIVDRAESTVDDVIDGGKRVVDDTAITAKDIVYNVTR